MESIKNELEAIKNQETQVQLRLFDNKNNKVAYQTLTVRELILLKLFIDIEWHDLKKEDDK